MCIDAGFQWCTTDDQSGGLTLPFILAYGMGSFSLGLVCFLAIMHLFGDENLRSVHNHHHWALLPIIVVLMNTLVCGLGVVRVFFRVLGKQAMRDVYPMLATFRVVLFYSLIVLYVLHVPICFYLMVVHMNNYKGFCERQKNKETRDRHAGSQTQ
jgi:hypothetical protein